MIYLLDANVLSEPTKPAPSAKVVQWLVANEAECAVDPIVLGELLIGILSLSGGRKRRQLEAWFEELTRTVPCLPWDVATAQRWARLVAELRRRGQSMPLQDSMIAATALVHGLTIATHNTRDFANAGVRCCDPFT